MSNMYMKTACAAITLLTSSMLSLAAADQNTLKQDVQQCQDLCKAAWKRLREQEAKPVGAKITLTDSDGTHSINAYTDSSQYYIEKDKIVACANSQYQFEITKVDKDQKWLLNRVILEPKEETLDHRVLRPNPAYGPIIRHLTFAPIDIFMLMENDLLAFNKCTSLSNGNTSILGTAKLPLSQIPPELLERANEALKKMKGKIPDADLKAAEKRIHGQLNTALINIEIEVDSKRDYLPVKGSITCSTIPTITYKFTRTMSNDPIRTTFETYRIEIVSKEKSQVFDFTRTSDFSSPMGYWLSDYGLPEPQGVASPSRANSNLEYILITVSIFAAIALTSTYLYLRAKRRKSAPVL